MEDLTVGSKLTQNLDGDYAGKLAAQALSGSVAGKNSSVSIACAISFVWSEGESTVDIANGSSLHGKDVVVEATNKSKIGARAGGVSLSKGSSFGMGLSSSTVVSGNNVSAALGEGVQVGAEGSFKLNAEKLAVTADDYKNLITAQYLVTDSSALTDEQRKEADTGLVDIHKGKDDDSYSMEINLSSEKLLDAVDGPNFLSGQNTYVEAIAGSIMSGKGTASAAGSVAVAVSKNRVNASIGAGALIGVRGDMAVNAADGNNARIIAGSLSAGLAKTSVGATVAVMVTSDEVQAVTGEGSKIAAEGSFSQNAETSGEYQVFTAAMAVAAGADVETKTAAGGAVNVIVAKNVAENTIGDQVEVQSGNKIDVTSSAKLDLIAISGSANVSAGAGGSVAAGGVVDVIVDSTKASTSLGLADILHADDALTVSSDVSDRMLVGSASVSAAATPTGSKTVAGVANVIVSKSAANTAINRMDADPASLISRNSDARITANNDAWLLNAGLSLAGSSGLAVGGAFNINVLDRQANVDIKQTQVEAGRDAYIQATGKDTKILAGLSVAGALEGIAVSGNVGVLVENSEIKQDAAMLEVDAGGNAVIEAFYEDMLIDLAGNIAVSGMSPAVGVTSLTVVKNNLVCSVLDQNSRVYAGMPVEKSKTRSGESILGIYVGANPKENHYIGGAGIAAGGGSAAINGVVTVLVNNNRVIADASQAILKAEETRECDTVEGKKWKIREVYKPHPILGFIMQGEKIDVSTLDPNDPATFNGDYYIRISYVDYVRLVPSTSYLAVEDNKVHKTLCSDVTVAAKDDTSQLLLAGGLSASASVAAGAAVVTLVSGKTVRAMAGEVSSNGIVNVTADNKDDIKQLAFSAGGSGSVAVQIGAAVQVLRSKAIAEIGGKVKGGAQVNLTAHNDTTLYNVGAAIAGSGAVAVIPVGVVTYFEGETAARVKGSGEVYGAIVNIEAAAKKKINLYSLGAAAAGTVGVSGTANVLVSRDSTTAETLDGSFVLGEDNVNISAAGDYKLRAMSGALAVAGVAGVAVNAVVSVMKSSTIASMAGTARSVNGAVNLLASGSRDVINAAATLGGGVAGVGVTVMVLSAGAAMSQDAHDMLVYGNGESKDEKAGKTFDSDKFMSAANNKDGQKGAASDYYDYETQYDSQGNPLLDENGQGIRAKREASLSNTLKEDIKGNGHSESAQQVGARDDAGNATFDASSKYRSSDLDNQNYDNDKDEGRGESLKTTQWVDKDGNAVAKDDPNAVEERDASDTADVKNAKEINTYKYYDPEDAVIARITESGYVEAPGVNIEAKQPVAVDLIGASVGAGVAGVGVSTAVAILHSNVQASSVGTISNAWNGINIQAESVSGTFEDDTNADARNKAVADYMSNKPVNEDDKDQDTAQDAKDKKTLYANLAKKVKNRSIRVFGLAVGAGVVGVAVSASVALTDNTTQAILGGKVANSGAISVNSKHTRGTVGGGRRRRRGGQPAVGLQRYQRGGHDR